MSLREDIEAVLRAWDKYERGRRAPAVIDYDCAPSNADISPAADRLSVHRRLSQLRSQASGDHYAGLANRLDAHLTYLAAVLGQRLPLRDYIRATQGCDAAGWPDDYVTACGKLAIERLGALGISWGPGTEAALEAAEGPLDAHVAPDAIRQAAADLEPVVRQATGADRPYELTITTTHEDAYWSYWLDGAGQHARLRLNLRNARFTKVQVRQFALHEILGHALQYATLSARCATEDVPWVRILSVHAPHQVLFEGLAQALSLFVVPDDEALVARTRLAHYLQLVRAELHVAINSGSAITECADHARARVPFWTDEQVSDLLTDRSADPLLRSYLWAYPAGLDWFVSLADTAPTAVREEVLRAAYQDPLTPGDLTTFWPTGPTIGGPGGAVRLRKPSLS